MEDCDTLTEEALFPMSIRRIGIARLKRRLKPLSQCEAKPSKGRGLWPLTVLDKEATQETGFLIRSISPCFNSHKLNLSVVPPMRKPRKGRPKASHTPKGNSSDASIDFWSRSATPTLLRPTTPINGTRLLLRTLKRKPKLPKSPKPPSRPSLTTTKPDLPRSFTKAMCGWEVTPL